MERFEPIEYIPGETHRRMLDGEITTEQYVEAMKKYVDRRLESDLERRMKLIDDRRDEPHTLTRIGRKVLGIFTKQAAP